MKGHKMHMSRHRKATGGVNEAEMDLKDRPQRYNNAKVEDEAEERKHGGRAKKKHVGKVHGDSAMHHAGRKPRKSGGGIFAFTAHKGEAPTGRKLEMN
jgi:hypothetical protein